MKDFFVSYNRADKQWAEWIAWTLEEAGYSVIIQAWDFRPGGNFVLDMQRAIAESNRTIAVLSEAYLRSSFPQPEWADAFASDPESLERKLLPVRVQECQPQGLLQSVVYVDLVGLAADQAKQDLLDALLPRAKPIETPSFPGTGESVLPVDEIAVLSEPLKRLVNLLSDTDFDAVVSIYRSCVEGRNREMPESLAALIARLNEIPGELDAPKPLVRFVNRLMREQILTAEQKQTVSEWAKEQNIRLNVSARTSTTPAGVENYLMVKVKPRSWNDPSLGYLITAAIIQDPVPFSEETSQLTETPISVPDGTNPQCAPGYAQTELPSVLSGLISICGGKQHRIPLTNLTVHCFLPIELLNLPVDHWQIRIGKKQRPCSAERCKAVILRAYDRHFPPYADDYEAAVGEWENAWRRLLENCDIPAQQALEPLDPTIAKTVIDWSQSEVVGCRFIEHPQAQAQEDFWDELMSQGCPTALWARQAGISAQTADAMMQSVCDCPIAELPDSLATQRQDVLPDLPPQTSEADRLRAAPIALLWDNPFRPFPMIAYQSD